MHERVRHVRGLPDGRSRAEPGRGRGPPQDAAHRRVTRWTVRVVRYVRYCRLTRSHPRWADRTSRDAASSEPRRRGKGMPVADEITSPIRRGAHDIAVERDRVRRRRVYRAAAFVIAIETWVIVNALLGRPIVPPMPAIDPLVLVPVLFFAALLLLLVGTQLGSARSPHVVFRPEQVDVRLDDVIGIDPVKEDVRRSIDLFQTHKQFAEQMGGTPRRGLLFEGLPGHRQDDDGQGHGRRGRGAVPVRLGDVVPVDVLRRDRQEDPRRTSRRCARRPAPRAARSASSRRSTPSRCAAAAWRPRWWRRARSTRSASRTRSPTPWSARGPAAS